MKGSLFVQLNADDMAAGSLEWFEKPAVAAGWIKDVEAFQRNKQSNTSGNGVCELKGCEVLRMFALRPSAEIKFVIGLTT